MHTPIAVDRGDGSVLTVTWDDGRVDRIGAVRLRTACPCAACQGNGRVLPGLAVGEVRAVGAYAIGITFAPDGHATGIYPFDLLREMPGGAT
ncbi:MAG TPA: DUF971 domain-containing protein [Acidimicrobiia bacterium]|nr:DUF971 domain-containing protein [Acidimicrobiia bacterium]